MPNTKSVSPEAAQILEDLIGGPLEVAEYKADCPAHASVSGQSLSVTITKDKVLLNCFAGCQTGDVLDALGLKYPDLFFSPTRSHGGHKKNTEPKLADFSRATAFYTYTTAAGEPVSRTVRFPERNAKKVVAQATYRDNTWWWGKPEGFKPVPYNLPEVYRAVLNGKPIYIFEGEPDVHAAAEWGLIGTTNPEGAGKFSDDLAPYFRGADVRIAQDDDKPGAAHAQNVASLLYNTARSVKLLPPLRNPEGRLGWDFRDWQTSGGTKQEFLALSDAAPFYSPHNPSKGSERGENKKLPSMTTDELYDAAREETPWVVNGLLVRGDVTDFVGAAKESGKTTFITHLVGHVTDGLTFINRAVDRSRVLYLTEMAPDNFRDYLQRAGVRRGDDLRTVFKRDVWELGWEELIEAAGEQCRAEGRGVLVVDTFAEFSGITGTEENNAGDIHKKMAVLRKVSQVHDLAVLLVRHANKEGKGRGSSAFEASVDILMLYKRPQSQDSETTVRTLEGLGRWTESNFKTNVDLKSNSFENIGNDKYIEFNRAARGILAAAGVGEENAKDRASLTKDLQTSRTTTDRALEWLVEHDSLVRVGEGVKGNPYKYFMPPKDYSPHAPGPIRSALGKKKQNLKKPLQTSIFTRTRILPTHRITRRLQVNW